MTLEQQFDDTLIYTNFLIEHVLGAGSIRAVVEPCVEISQYYRTLAVCELSTELDVDRFFHLLIHGALTRKYLLERCAKEGLRGEPEQRASILGPVFDAIVANQFVLARELMHLSSHSPCEGFEDSIDFAYAGVIEALLVPGAAGSPALRDALTAYEIALEGEADPRLTVCEALATRDAEAFEPAIEGLIENHRRDMKKLEVSIRSSEGSYAADCALFVEGLALLRIADRLGVPTKAEYSLCPSVARMTTFAPFVPSSFPNMPSPG